MKKILSVFIICLLPLMGANAQEKAAKQYLPEAGDWAIGVNVIPLLKHIGGNNNDTFGGGSSFTKDNSDFNLIPDVSILAKYMLTDNIALRANVGFMFGSDKYRGYVQDDKALLDNPLSEDKIIDACRVSNNSTWEWNTAKVRREYRACLEQVSFSPFRHRNTLTNGPMK